MDNDGDLVWSCYTRSMVTRDEIQRLHVVYVLNNMVYYDECHKLAQSLIPPEYWSPLPDSTAEIHKRGKHAKEMLKNNQQFKREYWRLIVSTGALIYDKVNPACYACGREEQDAYGKAYRQATELKTLYMGYFAAEWLLDDDVKHGRI